MPPVEQPEGPMETAAAAPKEATAQSASTAAAAPAGPTLSDYEALKRENAALRSELTRLQEGTKRKHKVVKTTLGSKMSHHVVSHQGKISRRHMRGTASSMASAEILAGLFTPRETVPERLLERLDDPSSHVAYFRGKQFALDLMSLCEQGQELFEKESRCLHIQSPCHVFGDIHGNLDDLHFFGENVWSKGIRLTPGRLLFLGDYVDRGMFSLECVAYLLAMKVLAPAKVFLLRGNHELRDVNSWEDYYGEGSFLTQCKDRFGAERGAYLWEVVNQLFDRLPLAAVIDHDIFCIHGGIPRPRPGLGQIESIQRVPVAAAVSPPYPCEDPDLTRVAYECLWSDPAKAADEAHMDARGYGANPRGSTAQCFGRAAVEDFLAEHDMSYIIRAHEKTAEGITVSKGGRVLTVFSTSKDHHLGDGAMSACLLVDDARIEVITKDPAYVSRTERRRRERAALAAGGSSAAAAAGPPAPISGKLFSFSDDHVFVGGVAPTTVEEEVVYFSAPLAGGGGGGAAADGGAAAAAALNGGGGAGATPAMVVDSDNDDEDVVVIGAAGTGAAAGGARALTLDLDDAQAQAAPQRAHGEGAVPSLDSPASAMAAAAVAVADGGGGGGGLSRRDSLDVGLFRQLRARAPQVVLQPSAEQRREFREGGALLPRSRASSAAASDSYSSDSDSDSDESVGDADLHADDTFGDDAVDLMVSERWGAAAAAHALSSGSGGGGGGSGDGGAAAAAAPLEGAGAAQAGGGGRHRAASSDSEEEEKSCGGGGAASRSGSDNDDGSDGDGGVSKPAARLGGGGGAVRGRGRERPAVAF